ncbi:hypothetical protein SUGI_0148450 [Cryptomeria japonica]|nr:hypothetical protein SUGI_0148450 [Cryptomeria japonica]
MTISDGSLPLATLVVAAFTTPRRSSLGASKTLGLPSLAPLAVGGSDAIVVGDEDPSQDEVVPLIANVAYAAPLVASGVASSGLEASSPVIEVLGRLELVFRNWCCSRFSSPFSQEEYLWES